MKCPNICQTDMEVVGSQVLPRDPTLLLTSYWCPKCGKRLTITSLNPRYNPPTAAQLKRYQQEEKEHERKTRDKEQFARWQAKLAESYRKHPPG